MGTVILTQRCPGHKAPMERVAVLTLAEGVGIEGDAHARPRSSRQVLLMAEENCDAFGLAPGEVRENLTIRGIDLQALPAGTRLHINDAVLEITKDCEPCSFIDSLRPGLKHRMVRRRGMLARVLRSGEVRVGDEVAICDRGELPRGS